METFWSWYKPLTGFPCLSVAHLLALEEKDPGGRSGTMGASGILPSGKHFALNLQDSWSPGFVYPNITC